MDTWYAIYLRYRSILRSEGYRCLPFDDWLDVLDFEADERGMTMQQLQDEKMRIAHIADCVETLNHEEDLFHDHLR